MSKWTVDPRFHTPANSSVLRFIHREQPSAHSDVADELIRAAAGVAGLHHYCPDPSRYAFFALHLDDLTIVGLAFGQSGIAFRLPKSQVDEAIRDRGVVSPELGDGWIRFDPWPVDEKLAESRRRLARWCAVAAGGVGP